MTNEEKAKAYDELVEKLWILVDNFKRSEERALGWYGANLETLLPPRLPRVVEVPWHEAIEGLASGKYRRTISKGESCWGEWRDDRLFIMPQNKEWTPCSGDLGTWRAELAR